MRIDTLAVHAVPVDAETGGLAPPIHLSTTFARDEGMVPIAGYTYQREGSPTPALFERGMASIEGGEVALAFASGMAAAAGILQGLVRGAHLLIPDDAYYGIRNAGSDFLEAWGVRWDAVDMTDPENLRRAIRDDTRVVWLESPSNPTLRVTDLGACAAIAHEAGAYVVVDGTFATPALQRPLELGADAVLHSTTKYLGGHSDVMGGVLIFKRRDERAARAEHARHVLGGVMHPLAAWLALRGLRTLPLRMERHSANAMAVARALEAHPAVSRVNYPGLPSHPGHEAASRQMRGFGGMLSFHVRAGREAAIDAVRRARLFVRATSLGGVESLIEHRQTSEGAGSRAAPDLIRLSVGIEHPDDLVADLVQALG